MLLIITLVLGNINKQQDDEKLAFKENLISNQNRSWEYNKKGKLTQTIQTYFLESLFYHKNNNLFKMKLFVLNIKEVVAYY